jgi:Protein of unknown function (DUF4019)
MLGHLRRFSAVSVLVFAACGPAKSPEAPPLSASSSDAAAVQPSPAPSAATPADPNVDAATAVAKSWLALVDEQKYAESWNGAAKAIQTAVSSENWAKSVGGAREPLGKLVSRQVHSAEFKTSLPGAPDGKYVVIQFATAFEKKAQAVETVTPSQEADGSWKVSGYFIK